MDNPVVGNDDCKIIDVVDILQANQAVLDDLQDLSRRLNASPSMSVTLDKQINANNIKYPTLLHSLLEDWRSRNSGAATLEALIQILQSDQHISAADELRRNFNSRNPVIGNDDCKILDVVDILKNHRTILQNWVLLANRLNTPASLTVCLEQTNTPITPYPTLLYDLLEHWRSRESSAATLAELVRVLEQANHGLAADQLRRFFNKP
ncbi:hypothetical protein Ocin01_13792 [Orchesella cincta]|uniref:Death domain-containing protein n=1 Tax=Orchesella cincta TaxID=48709 RepID=A0A1D2MIZ1_ORCCI|nr:hypothetical protein Ocin01_13792 [Orchesella cincta]